jgi:radical SAM superfamily enzyme YgiQ (UPF0313 family)
MKILLVVKSKVMENLGVMYLSSVIKKAGSQCKIVEFSDAMTCYKIWKPEVVGFSIMTGDKERFRELADKIRDYDDYSDKKTVIIVGGADPTFFPTGYEWADHIVRGEAEQWFADFLGYEVDYSDINSIPHPDRSDFPGMKIRDFISSRGCGSACGYCYNSTWYKLFPDVQRIRVRKVDDVIKEILHAQPEFVYYQDSCFGVNMNWMREFSKKYGQEVRVPYHCHLRPEQCTEERVLALHDSNCVSVKIALETGSDRLRKLINRGKTNNEDAYKACRMLRKWDIAVIMQNILGLPTATMDEDLGTLEQNIRCRPSYSWVSIFQPYPKTELADKCEKNGWYQGDYSEIGDNFFDKSLLSCFTDEHKEHVEVLQKIFALCVDKSYLPKEDELTWENFPKLVHKIMRVAGDKKMFPGIDL